jgi:hypothetical protein
MQGGSVLDPSSFESSMGGVNMPAFGAVLSASELQNLVAFLVAAVT